MRRRELAERLIYGHELAGRFTQDSPVLPDVWIACAEKPRARHDLLITPFIEAGSVSSNAGRLRCELRDRLRDEAATGPWKAFHRGETFPAARVAYNQSTVAACLTFHELVRVVLPLSRWWTDRVFKRGQDELQEYFAVASKRAVLVDALAYSRSPATNPKRPKFPPWLTLDVVWMIRVIGLLGMAADEAATGDRDEVSETLWPETLLSETARPDEPEDRRRHRRDYHGRIVRKVSELFSDLVPISSDQARVYSVSRNRRAGTTIWKSAAAVKADAAARLFDTACGELSWAVIDSGIDARHPAFRQRYDRTREGRTESMLVPLPARVAETAEDSVTDPRHREWRDGNKAEARSADWADRTRIVATYDFTIIRHLLTSDDETVPPPEPVRARIEKVEKKLAKRFPDGVAAELRKALKNGRDLEWTVLEPFLRIDHDAEYEIPRHDHGTHVAGILGADWRRADGDPMFPSAEDVQGMCPDIRLYDLRVLDERGEGDEFNVMAALQFVRSLNAHKDYRVVHGVNLSLSIPHDVANYACGRTPVCEECERLVGAGIVVVAAAGNDGYLQYLTAKGYTEGYRSISITDPGNAEGVITVGSTHRDQPHTYGVSYFSSRGPTGDGRAKPDLVAPGEKIEAPVPSREVKRKDGTSMAAPHVSGAAALLIARHRELAGQPRRIKEILCKSATDLGRERYFQGAGMLDVLRAIQSV